MTTFSQLVDEITLELLRPDLRVSIAAYLNSTIREIHAVGNTGLPILFSENRLEVEFSPLTVPAVWPIPSTPRFQRLEVAYESVKGVYYKERALTRINDASMEPYWWYRTGSNIAFSNLEVGETVELAYFEFPRLLTYYAAAARPATWSSETETFTYLPAYDVDETTRENARNLSTNWLLLRWGELALKQGIRSKVWSRLGDMDRARIAYSAFEAMRVQLIASEEWKQNQL